jgi:integrase
MARDGVLTAAQGIAIVDEMVQASTGETIGLITVEQHFDEWLESKEARKSPRTAERYSSVLEMFKAHLGPKARKPLRAVTIRDVQGFLDARLKGGAAPKTVSVDRKSLSSAFNTALKHGLILHNPVPATEIPKVVSSERDVFASGQVTILLSTLTRLESGESITYRLGDAQPSLRLESEQARDWRTAIMLGYFTGARLRDCVGMRLDNVDFNRSTILHKQQKTDQQVEIPMHPELELHLERIFSTDKPEEYLCPSLLDKSTGGAHGLSQTFKAIMRAAGLDPATAKGMGSRQFSRLSFHSLRHSFNSALANAGVNQEVRMRLTGHTSAEMNRRYTHHELAPLKRAVGKLPSLTH